MLNSDKTWNEWVTWCWGLENIKNMPTIEGELSFAYCSTKKWLNDATLAYLLDMDRVFTHLWQNWNFGVPDCLRGWYLYQESWLLYQIENNSQTDHYQGKC